MSRTTEQIKKEMYLGSESHLQVKIKYVHFFIFIKYNHLFLIITKFNCDTFYENTIRT